MKRPVRARWLQSVAVAAAAALLAACGSSSSSGTNAAAGAGSSSGTTSVSVGTMAIKQPKSHLKIGLFMNAESNQYQEQVIKGAQQAAQAAGDSLAVLNANFQVDSQVSQLTQAATDHQFQAIAVVPIDGNSVCSLVTEKLPQAGIVVSVSTEQVCNRQNSATGLGMWAPGTLNYVGGDVSYPGLVAFVNKTGALNPGPQNVAVVVGPQTGPATIAEQKAFNAYAAARPDFHIAGYIYTDYTTPTTYSDMLTYLRAHPNTTLIMSVYSPDLTRGVIQALKATGQLGKIKVTDQGGSSYSIQEIKAGNIEFTMPYFPFQNGYLSVQSLIEAAQGAKPARFIDCVPAKYGSYSNPVAISRLNVGSFTPEY